MNDKELEVGEVLNIPVCEPIVEFLVARVLELRDTMEQNVDHNKHIELRAKIFAFKELLDLRERAIGYINDAKSVRHH